MCMRKRMSGMRWVLLTVISLSLYTALRTMIDVVRTWRSIQTARTVSRAGTAKGPISSSDVLGSIQVYFQNRAPIRAPNLVGTGVMGALTYQDLQSLLTSLEKPYREPGQNVSPGSSTEGFGPLLFDGTGSDTLESGS